MKKTFLIILIMLFNFRAVALAEKESKIILREIRSDEGTFQHEVKIEFDPSLKVRINTVSLEYVPGEKSNEKKDMLYVKGTVQKFVYGFVVDTVVKAEFLDKDGILIDTKEGKVFPRVSKRQSYEKGIFNIVTDYDPSIALIRLDVSWLEKE